MEEVHAEECGEKRRRDVDEGEKGDCAHGTSGAMGFDAEVHQEETVGTRPFRHAVQQRAVGLHDFRLFALKDVIHLA